MKPLGKRTLRLLLNFGAILGILIAIAGLVAVWLVRGRVQTALQTGVELAVRTVDTTSDTLSVIAATLEQARESLATVETTAHDVAETLDATGDITDTFSGVAGEDMVAVLADAQTALGSMQQSAVLIDDTLAVISGIPLIGARYNPETTLEDGIGKLASSLEPVPESLAEIQTEMQRTTTNLDVLRQDVEELADHLSAIQTNLDDASALVAEYEDIVAELDGHVQQAGSAVQPALTGFAVALSLFFIWMIIAQLSLVLQARGFE
ncbi:MAG: hypothetical protein HPY76_06065 [Anaerolineae bacterium]|nr:hypothetical protein [Anaerolineae bacterium]